MSRKHGELEKQVLGTIWDLEESGVTPVTSAQILEHFVGAESIAPTTLLTVLSRLADKELIVRDKIDGKSLAFKSARSRTETTVDALIRLVENSDKPEVAVASFVGSLPKKLLNQLKNELDKN